MQQSLFYAPRFLENFAITLFLVYAVVHILLSPWTCTGKGLLGYTLSLLYPNAFRVGLESASPSVIYSIMVRGPPDNLYLTHATSLSTSYQKTNYKLLARWYRVPKSLHSISQSLPSQMSCSGASLLECPIARGLLLGALAKGTG